MVSFFFPHSFLLTSKVSKTLFSVVKAVSKFYSSLHHTGSPVEEKGVDNHSLNNYSALIAKL